MTVKVGGDDKDEILGKPEAEFFKDLVSRDEKTQDAAMK